MNILPHDRFEQLSAYADLGWKLLPLWERNDQGVCACKLGAACTDKHPRIRWQNPGDGESGATDNIRIILSWLDAWPDCDWAVVCDDFFVVDVDKKHGGLETLAEVEENLPGLLWPTLTQKTPSGGYQFFYQQPPERDIHTVVQGRLKNLAGFEIKGLTANGTTGHYVGIPPSRGRSWCDTVTQNIAEPTSNLLEVIRSAKAGTTNGPSGGNAGEAYNWSLALTPGGIMYDQDGALYRAALSARSLSIPDRLAVPLLRRIVECFINTDASDPWDLNKADVKWEYVKGRFQQGKTEVTFTEAQRAFAQKVATRWTR